MIKDIFKLKKKSWHMYLMEFLWGLNHTNFPNMCPYFWLSGANVIISPIAVPLWGIVKIIRITNSNIKDYKARKKAINKEIRRARYLELIEKQKGFEQLRLLAIYNKNSSLLSKKEMSLARKFRDDFDSLLSYEERKLSYHLQSTLFEEEIARQERKWKESALHRAKKAANERKKYERYEKNIREEQLNRRQKYDRRDRRFKAKQIRKAKIRKFFAPIRPSHATKQKLIGKWTIRIKAIAKVIKIIFVVCVVSLIIWGVVKLIIFLIVLDYSIIPWAKLGYLLIGMIGGGIGVLVVVLTIKGLVLLVQIIGENSHKFGWLRHLLLVFYIFYPFVLLWKGLKWVGKKLKSFWYLIKALKTDNCPGIDWE